MVSDTASCAHTVTACNTHRCSLCTLTPCKPKPQLHPQTQSSWRVLHSCQEGVTAASEHRRCCALTTPACLRTSLNAQPAQQQAQQQRSNRSKQVLSILMKE